MTGSINDSKWANQRIIRSLYQWQHIGVNGAQSRSVVVSEHLDPVRHNAIEFTDRYLAQDPPALFFPALDLVLGG